MRRRDFIAGIGSTPALMSRDPRLALAQPSATMTRIGVLMGLAPTDHERKLQSQAFEAALTRLGWRPGIELEIDYGGDGKAAHFQSEARRLLEAKPKVVIAHTTGAALALRNESGDVPIVFVSILDPVGEGMVSSLAKPGGNSTGFSSFEPSLAGKWLEFLTMVAPRTERAAVLYNPETIGSTAYLKSLQAAAETGSVQLVMAEVRDDAAIEAAIGSISHAPGSALIVMPDIFTGTHRRAIITAADRHRVPAIYPFRFFATDGGLIYYGVDVVDLFRRAASYVDRILKGAKPADLPVQQPVKLELVVNLKTAKALDLTVPQPLLATADQVIE